MQAVCYFRDYEEIASSGFFKGYDGIVWTVILLQAGGGLVSINHFSFFQCCVDG